MKQYLLSIIAFQLTWLTYAQMSGTYTVGGTNPDFTTVGEACTNLSNQGISGPVTINIRDGIYYDSIHLISLTGTSPTNTITFQSESLNAAAVEIVNSNFHALYLSGSSVSHITVQFLTFTTGSDNSAVRGENGIKNFTLTDCVINGTTALLPSVSNAAIYIPYQSAQNNDSIWIRNNTINNGTYGVAASNFSFLNSSIIVENNVFENNYLGGVNIIRYAKITVSNNTIFSNIPAFDSKGIQVYETIDSLLIAGNSIYRSAQTNGKGIQVDYTASYALIKNNMVSLPGTINWGLVCDYLAGQVEVVNNTFRVPDDVITGYYDSQVKFLNNILISTNGGKIYDLSYNDNTVQPITNNNAYFTNGPIFAYLDYPFDQSYPTWADYNAATGQSSNSFELTDFMFVNDLTDLHACNDSLIGSGVFWPGVNDDVDGETRAVPSVGADYHTISGSIWNSDTLGTCTGVPVILDAGPADSYLWSTSETSQAISAANFGLYSVEWIGTCGSYFDTVYILDVTPVAEFTYFQSFLTFAFTNNSLNGTDYFWDFGDGFTSTEMNPIHTYNTLNTYSVSLTVTNHCGSSTYSMQVTPSIVGMDEEAQPEIKIAPNPTSDYFTITADLEIESINITDSYGRSVLNSSDLEANEPIQVDLTPYTAGIYNVVVITAGRKISKRIVKL